MIQGMHTGWSSMMHYCHRQFRVLVHQISSSRKPDQHLEFLVATLSATCYSSERKTQKNIQKSRAFIWWNPSQYQPMRNLNCHILCINYEFRFFQFLPFTRPLLSVCSPSFCEKKKLLLSFHSLLITIDFLFPIFN